MAVPRSPFLRVGCGDSLENATHNVRGNYILWLPEILHLRCRLVLTNRYVNWETRPAVGCRKTVSREQWSYVEEPDLDLSIMSYNCDVVVEHLNPDPDRLTLHFGTVPTGGGHS